MIIWPFMPAVLSWNLVAHKLLQIFDVVQRKYFFQHYYKCIIFVPIFQRTRSISFIADGFVLKGCTFNNPSPSLLYLLYNRQIQLLFKKVRYQQKSIKMGYSSESISYRLSSAPSYFQTETQPSIYLCTFKTNY